MPHFIIEYSRDLEESVDIDALMQTTFDVAVASGIMNPEDIKIRALSYSHFRLEGCGKSFVHASCKLLAGRTTEQKVRLSKLLRQSLADLLPYVYSISVDVIDMDAEAYKKRLLHVVPT